MRPKSWTRSPLPTEDRIQGWSEFTLERRQRQAIVADHLRMLRRKPGSPSQSDRADRPTFRLGRHTIFPWRGSQQAPWPPVQRNACIPTSTQLIGKAKIRPRHGQRGQGAVIGSSLWAASRQSTLGDSGTLVEPQRHFASCRALLVRWASSHCDFVSSRILNGPVPPRSFQTLYPAP